MSKNREKFDVPVQKGSINPNPMTSKQMIHPEKIKEREMEIKKVRWGQTLDLHVPREKR